MLFRKKKPTVRETLEDRYADLASQVADKAPVIRDQVVAKLHDSADEARTRWPELVDRLPDDVSDRLPEAAKPKKKKSRLKKIALIGIIATAGGVAYSRVKSASNAPSPYTPPAGPAPDLTHSSAPTDVPDGVDDLADGAAPGAVK